MTALGQTAFGQNSCFSVLAMFGQVCSCICWVCSLLSRGCCVRYFCACSSCVGDCRMCVGVQQHFLVSTFLGVFNIAGGPPPKRPSAGPVLRRTAQNPLTPPLACGRNSTVSSFFGQLVLATCGHGRMRSNEFGEIRFGQMRSRP